MNRTTKLQDGTSNLHEGIGRVDTNKDGGGQMQPGWTGGTHTGPRATGNATATGGGGGGIETGGSGTGTGETGTGGGAGTGTSGTGKAGTGGTGTENGGSGSGGNGSGTTGSSTGVAGSGRDQATSETRNSCTAQATSKPKIERWRTRAALLHPGHNPRNDWEIETRNRESEPTKIKIESLYREMELD